MYLMYMRQNLKTHLPIGRSGAVAVEELDIVMGSGYVSREDRLKTCSRFCSGVWEGIRAVLLSKWAPGAGGGCGLRSGESDRRRRLFVAFGGTNSKRL